MNDFDAPDAPKIGGSLIGKLIKMAWYSNVCETWIFILGISTFPIRKVGFSISRIHVREVLVFPMFGRSLSRKTSFPGQIHLRIHAVFEHESWLPEIPSFPMMKHHISKTRIHVQKLFVFAMKTHRKWPFTKREVDQTLEIHYLSENGYGEVLARSWVWIPHALDSASGGCHGDVFICILSEY